MTKRDPEKNREYARRWREANPDRVRENAARHREANREAINERQRRRYQEDPEAHRERTRERYRANPEKVREQNRRSYQANRERRQEYARQARLNGYKTPRQRQHAEIVAKLWHSQGGRCYLCEEPMPVENAVLEHDHRCHPKQNTYCASCLRGAACTQCNTAIGLLHDNPDVLERVAANLRIKLAEMATRIAARPMQDTLDL